MGAARLLARFWIAFCLFAGAHALAGALAKFVPPEQAISVIGSAVVLFCAMGLLFIGGFGAAAGGLSKFTSRSLAPGFNDLVFAVFAAVVFSVQIVFAPGHMPGGALGALQAAIQYVVPGQGALESKLTSCSLDGGREFSSAMAWILAFIFLGSAISRLRLQAGLLRLERKASGASLGALPLTFALGLLSLIGVQCLFMGSAYNFIPCDELSALPGNVLIGLGPLALAYLIVAALTNLLALSPEA